ncbi:restriction endonuclease subunit S [Arcanobacterium pinnipediorum]|uniref:Restriction endonuclease subunit S n=1 Tax=Arcanobacterium pinnipediorum TaxID=1503041 RepID=A0ABY5AIH4_9ACTO|nr:restriction endonuclease subunit S [Arcanobacterium pinnipediorum]USR79034.1 restriction endonuclease subunit S [Arcanobacterium pinnipediorum]
MLRKLGDIAPMIYGKSLPSRKRNTGTIPVVSSGGLTGVHDQALIYDPCVVIGRKGTIGSVYYLDSPCFPIDTVFYTRGSEHVYLKYLYYFLLTLPLEDMNNDSAVPGLNRTELESLDVRIPSMEEQHAIAATLGALDEKIESNRNARTKFSDLIEALSEKFEERLPLVSLGSIGTFSKATVNPKKMGDSLVNHFSLPAFDAGVGPEEVQAFVIKSNKLLLPDKSVLISRLNPRIERMWWAISQQGLPSLASTEFLVLTAKNELELAALWLAVRSPSFRRELPQRVTGTSGSHQRVRPADVLSIVVPDFTEAGHELKQQTLALLHMDAALCVESRRLAALRDALLPELMSGRIRVPEAREAIEKEIG